MSIVARPATEAELPVCLSIRRVVFIEGQAVPEAEEVDGKDPSCHHVIAFLNDRPIGTARLRPIDGETAKIERVAVLEEFRGHGVGVMLMEVLESTAREIGCLGAKLGAQVQVIGFYERLGYVVVGPEFLDAGIRHRMMEKAL